MKLQFLYTLLALASLATAQESYQSYNIKRPDQSDCNYYLNTSQTQGTFSIILLLQGSEHKSVVSTGFITLIKESWLAKLNCALLAIEKPGVQPHEFNKQQYLTSNHLIQRTEDCRMVLNHLIKTEPKWNGSVILVGFSEGAMLAAYLTPQISKTTATMLFSGGCGMNLKDEILLLVKKEALDLQKTIQYYGIYLYINLMLTLSKCFPQSTYTCIGETNSLAYWNHIADYNPLDSLKNTSVPLYLAQGTADTNCPVESAEKLIAAFKTNNKNNLWPVFYEGYDHCFTDKNGVNYLDTVIDEGFEWLTTQLRANNA